MGILNSSAAVYREAISIMPLEEVFILILGRRILLMICESEDRLTGRAIIVVARTTDYCFSVSYTHLTLPTKLEV